MNIDSAAGLAVLLLVSWCHWVQFFEDVVVTNFVVTDSRSTAPMQSRSCTGLHGQLCIQEVTAASGRGTHAHTHTHTSARTPVNASSVTSPDCKPWFSIIKPRACRISPSIQPEHHEQSSARVAHTMYESHTQCIDAQWQQQHHGCTAAPVAGSPRQPGAHTRRHAPPHTVSLRSIPSGEREARPTETQALPISATVL